MRVSLGVLGAIPLQIWKGGTLYLEKGWTEASLKAFIRHLHLRRPCKPANFLSLGSACDKRAETLAQQQRAYLAGRSP